MKNIKSGISLFLLFVFAFVQIVPGDYSIGAASRRTQALSPFLEAGAQTSGASGTVKAVNAAPVLDTAQYTKTNELRAVNDSNDKAAFRARIAQLVSAGVLTVAGIFAGMNIAKNMPKIKAVIENIQIWALGIKESVYAELFTDATPEHIESMQSNLNIVVGFFTFVGIVMAILVTKRIVSSIIVVSREKIKFTKFDLKMAIGYVVRLAVIAAAISALVPIFPGIWTAYLGAGTAISSYMINTLGSPVGVAVAIDLVQKGLAVGVGAFAVRAVLLSLFPNWKLDATLKDFKVELLPKKDMLKVAGRYLLAIALVIGAFSLPVLLLPVIPGIVQFLGQYAVIAGAFLAVTLLLSLVELTEVSANMTKKYGKNMQQNPLSGIYTYQRKEAPKRKYYEKPKKAPASASEAQIMNGVEKLLAFALSADLLNAESQAALNGAIRPVADVNAQNAATVDAMLQAMEHDAQIFMENRLFYRRIKPGAKKTLRALEAGILVKQWKECREIFGATLDEQAKNIANAFAELYSTPVIADADSVYSFAKEGQFLKLIRTPVRARQNGPIFVAALYHRILEHNMDSFLGNIPQAQRSAERRRYEQFQVFKFVDSLPIRPTYMQWQFDAIFGEQSYENTLKSDSGIFAGFFNAVMAQVTDKTAKTKSVSPVKQAGMILSAA